MATAPRKKVAPAKAAQSAPKRQSARARALATDAAKLAARKSNGTAPAKKVGPAKVAKPEKIATFDMLDELNAVVTVSSAFPNGRGDLPRAIIHRAFVERLGRSSNAICETRASRLTAKERDALVPVLADVKAGKIAAPVRAAARVAGPSKGALADRLAKVEHLLNEAHSAKTISAMRQHVVSALDVITGNAAS